MKPYGREEDLSYQPGEKDANSQHPHRWLRKERRLIKRAERKSARQQAKKDIKHSVIEKEKE